MLNCCVCPQGSEFLIVWIKEVWELLVGAVLGAQFWDAALVIHHRNRKLGSINLENSSGFDFLGAVWFM